MSEPIKQYVVRVKNLGGEGRGKLAVESDNAHKAFLLADDVAAKWAKENGVKAYAWYIDDQRGHEFGRGFHLPNGADRAKYGLVPSAY